MEEKHVGIFFSSQIFRVSQQQLHRSVTRCFSPLSDPKNPVSAQSQPIKSGKRKHPPPPAFFSSVYANSILKFHNAFFCRLAEGRWVARFMDQQQNMDFGGGKHWNSSYAVFHLQRQGLLSAILSYPWALTLRSWQLAEGKHTLIHVHAQLLFTHISAHGFAHTCARMQA